MKPFSEHLHDVVSETRPISEDSPEPMDMCEEAAKRYAREAIAEHLERAAENAGTKAGETYPWIKVVDKESIRNIEIKLP